MAGTLATLAVDATTTPFGTGDVTVDQDAGGGGDRGRRADHQHGRGREDHFHTVQAMAGDYSADDDPKVVDALMQGTLKVFTPCDVSKITYVGDGTDYTLNVPLRINQNTEIVIPTNGTFTSNIGISGTGETVFRLNGADGVVGIYLQLTAKTHVYCGADNVLVPTTYCPP